MPAAEITAAITGLRAAYDLTKGMILLRDADLFVEKARELNNLLADVQHRLLSSYEAQTAQLDEISALKAKNAELVEWDADKQRYELKKFGLGSFVYMLKPEARGVEPPHWLCPNCYHAGKKSLFQATMKLELGRRIYECHACNARIPGGGDPKWLD